MRGTRWVASAAGVGALVAVMGACASATPSGVGVRVVATTTVLGDVAGQVVTCGGGEVATLMPIGADPHDFAASSADVTALVRADLVVANGLGLEEGLASALESAAADGARVLEVAPLLDPLPFGGDEHADDAERAAQDEEVTTDEHADEAGSLDPHVWLDASRMATAAALIGEELAAATGEDVYAACGAEVAEELAALDAEVRAVLAAVPAQARRLVTDHDAFGYLAAAYDVEVVGVVIPGGSTLGQPSTAQLAALVDTIEQTGVSVIVANTSNPSTLVDAVAAESGQRVAVVELYEGSLGPPGSGAETYAALMRTNAERLATAFGG